MSKAKKATNNVTLEQVMMATDAKRPKHAIPLKSEAPKFDEAALASISAGTEQHISGTFAATAGVEMIASGFDKAFYADHDFAWVDMVMKPNQKKYEGDLVAQKCYEVFAGWRDAYASACIAKGKSEEEAKSAVSTQWNRIKKASAIAPEPKPTEDKDLVKAMVKTVRAVVKADAEVRENSPKLFTGEDHKTMIAVASAWLAKYDG